MKNTFLILLILSFFSSQGQPAVDSWYSKITKKIDRIQKTEFDSVYSYISIYGSASWKKDLKGVGKIDPSGEAILIGFKKNRISCIKIIQSYDSVFSSKLLNLKVDSMLQSLRTDIAGSDSEFILPYICQVYSDSAGNIKGFEQVQPRLHSPFCSIYFKCSTKSQLTEFVLESLNEKYENSNTYPPNLNFKYNSSLKSYRLYLFLNTLLAKYEHQFDFGK